MSHLSLQALKSDPIEDLEKAEQTRRRHHQAETTPCCCHGFLSRSHGTPGFITAFPG